MPRLNETERLQRFTKYMFISMLVIFFLVAFATGFSLIKFSGIGEVNIGSLAVVAFASSLVAAIACGLSGVGILGIGAIVDYCACCPCEADEEQASPGETQSLMQSSSYARATAGTGVSAGGVSSHTRGGEDLVRASPVQLVPPVASPVFEAGSKPAFPTHCSREHPAPLPPPGVPAPANLTL